MKTREFSKFLVSGILTVFLGVATVTPAAPGSTDPQSQANPTSPQSPVATPGIFQQSLLPELPAKATPPAEGISVRADFSGTNLQVPANTFVSFWTTEVIKLTQAAIDEQITCAFINSVGTFNLGSDQIVYLHQQGVPDAIIRAMIQHDQEIAKGGRRANMISAPIPNVSLPFTLVAKNEQTTSNPVDSIRNDFESDSKLTADPLDPDQVSAASGTVVTESSPLTRAQSAADRLLAYPLRQPHAVQLTGPILVIRGASRPANVVTVGLIP
jgi:hypothetical protein